MIRSARRLFICFCLFVPIAGVHAQSAREQLAQLVEQLQKAPTDNALREKIIKLAQNIKPAPAIPDKAIEFEGRAQFAFKSAKSEADFLAAAHEYEKAVAVAPWVQGYYADLCTIYEKAGKFEDAKRNCKSYLIGLIDPAQMTDVKRRIAGLEFGIEKTNSSQTAKASTSAGPDFSGCWQGQDTAGTQYCEFSFEPNGNSWIVRDSDKKPLNIVKVQGRQLWIDQEYGGFFTRHYVLILSEDNQRIERAIHDTQSPEQRSRYESKFPGSRLSELNVPKQGSGLKKRTSGE